MKLPHRFDIIAGLALMALLLLATPATTAQTVISNETLVTTTFVVNKQSATAKCKGSGCSAKTAMFAPIPVTCPAASGQTCTFHISLDAKTTIVLGCGNCAGSGSTGFYQFLVDDAAPTIGPTDKEGNYLFERYAYSGGLPGGASRQSYPASLLTTVTNSNSNSHTITLRVGCRDVGKLGGCQSTTNWSTMRVDVFEP
jgi:hypothetical protein